MLRPDGTYEEWIAFERSGSIGRWHHVIWETKTKADQFVLEVMLSDPSICCLHHSPTQPTTERPGSAFCEANVLEATR